jgi:hypothetical protein
MSVGNAFPGMQIAVVKETSITEDHRQQFKATKSGEWGT